MMYLETQLQWIRDLQAALRSPWMDGFFKVWNAVDTAYFSDPFLITPLSFCSISSWRIYVLASVFLYILILSLFLINF